MKNITGNYKNISPTIVIITFMLLVFTTTSIISRGAAMNPKIEWDVLIFTQNWPSTVCREWEESSKMNNCSLPSDKNKWTIHGIWPTKVGTKGPGFCDPSKPFNEEEIYGLLPDLLNSWTPIEIHKKKNSFWRHEWEKHGTCASVLPSLDSEFKYFSRGLEWSKVYNMRDILQKAKIYPRNDAYDPLDIWNRVKKIVGTTPFIMCYKEPKTGLSFLQEIRLCFNRNLTLINCDGIKVEIETGDGDDNLIECPEKEKTYYLTNVPKRVTHDHPLVTLLKTIKLIQWATF